MMTNREKLEFAFRSWLEIFMAVRIEHWDKLSIYERDILLDHCWNEFEKDLIKIYSNIKG